MDASVSEVVQLHRSHESGGCVVRGRIFAEFSYWNLHLPTPEVVRKGDGFRRWYESLERWIKRQYHRIGLAEYVGPGAAAYAAAGGKLLQG